MIKGIVIGAVVMYLLGAVEGLNEYLYLSLWNGLLKVWKL